MRGAVPGRPLVLAMCGIVGYAGPKDGARTVDVVLGGLRRLEYRGYDSAGVAVVDGTTVASTKRAGKLANLLAALEAQPLPDSGTGIGHTRWATHGGPTDENAHPHRGGTDGRLALIHNGIIENFAGLKAALLADGAEFTSETDTEVAAHMLAAAYADTGDLTKAMQAVCSRLDGAFTLLAVHADEPGTVVGARRNSPLVVGLGEGENYLGSDVSAFIAHSREAIELGQDQVVTITADAVDGHRLRRRARAGTSLPRRLGRRRGREGRVPVVHGQGDQRAAAGGRRHAAGPDRRRTPARARRAHVPESVLRAVDKIVVIACGTAAYAGQVAKYAIEHWGRIPCEVELAHEFRYRDPVVDERTLVVAISQSGETMDTIMAVRHAREQGARVVAVCNTHGSTIPRECDAVLYTHAGPEVAVASTKAFLAQITACYLLGLYLAELRGGSGRRSREMLASCS